jgi:opacity protein-like surface antigen
MRSKLLFFVATVCLLASAASAQNYQNYQTDFRQEISTQGTGNFTSSTNDLLSNITSSASNSQSTRSGGFLIGYRYHLARWFAVEGDYAFTRQTQNFFDPINIPNGSITSALKTNIHEITGAAVITSGPRHRVRPYGLLGGGAILFRPVNPTVNSVLNIVNNLGFGPSETKPAFLYGAGVDIGLNRFLAIRAEYRGLMFSAPGFQIPGLSVLGLSTPGLTHMAQPSAGLVWRF